MRLRKSERDEIHSGDAERFNRLYAEFAPRILGYLRLLTGNRAAAEDLLQETFLAAYSGRSAYKGTASPLAWLLGIARRRWRDARRAPPPQHAPLSEAIPSHEDVAADVARRSHLECCLLQLEPSLQEAVTLILAEGLTYAEAAQALGEPIGTVKWRVHRATGLLREMLSREEGTE